MSDVTTKLANEASDKAMEIARLKADNDRLRELATHALRHIIEFECEADDREELQGKPCEWCVYDGSSDCPKIIAVMYGELGVEVDA